MAQTWTRWTGWCLMALMIVAAMGIFLSRYISFDRFVESAEMLALGDDLVLEAEGPEPGDLDAFWVPPGEGRFPLLPIRGGLVGTLSRKQVRGLVMRALLDEEGVAPVFLVDGVDARQLDWSFMEETGTDTRYRFRVSHAGGEVIGFFVETVP